MEVSNDGKKRIEWIDSLKGLAIILVVIGHIADGYIDAGSFPDYSGMLRNIFNGIYMFHMALFFSICGMTYKIAYLSKTNDERDSDVRFKAQLINLLLLYVFYCILNWAFKIMLSRFVNKPVSFTDIFLIWAKPIYQYWFLYVLVILYLIFRWKIFEKNSNIILVVLFSISLFSGYVNIGEWFQITHILFYAFFFWLGIMYVKNRDYWLFSIPSTIVFFAVSMIIAILWWNKESNICWTPVINCLAALGIVLTFVRLFAHLSFANKKMFLNYLGKHSLEIYVIHCFLTAGNRTILPKIGIHSMGLSFTLNFVISIMVPLIFSFITKKIGVYKIFFAPYQLFKKDTK